MDEQPKDRRAASSSCPPDVLEFIASKIQTNYIRELEAEIYKGILGPYGTTSTGATCASQQTVANDLNPLVRDAALLRW